MENAVTAAPVEAKAAAGQNRHHDQLAGTDFDKSSVTGKTARPIHLSGCRGGQLIARV
jgi:hypothetical protein